MESNGNNDPVDAFMEIEPDPSCIEDRQRRFTKVYLEQGKRKITCTIKKDTLEKQKAKSEFTLRQEFKSRKEAGDKGMTEAYIDAALAQDPVIASIQDQIDQMGFAEQLQLHRLRSLERMHDHLLSLHHDYHTERKALR